MIRVRIELEPAGDQNHARTLGEITITNVTPPGEGRVSSDHMWRVRWLTPKKQEKIAYGSLVDSHHYDVVDLLREVVELWKTGETACPDNHGQMVDLTSDYVGYWKRADPNPTPLE